MYKIMRKMVFSETMNKLARVLIIISLCSGMASSVTQKNSSTFEGRVLSYSSNTNSTEATLRNAQHHASIRLKERDQEFGDGHICSGVVIGPSAVLTTAHCVYNYNTNKPYHPSELSIVLASRSRYQRQQQTLVFGVTHSYQPETFNVLSSRDNVAILMLDRDIPKVNDFVKPITLPQNKYNNTSGNEKGNSKKFKVTTWLKTNEGSSLNHLMLLNASQVSDETCLQYYGETVFGAGMLCVVSLESLNKDFGSPLFIVNKLVGLRSFAAGPLSPVIYTDLSHYNSWIRTVVGDGSNQNSCIWGILAFLLFTFVALKRTKFLNSAAD